MANWKKVIVSGSNAHLNHITASGDVSASGFLFGNLPSGNHDEVVIYNTATGRLEFKVLNLINTQTAPNLFLIDQSSPADNNSPAASFRLSHAPGNTSLQSENVFPYIQLSASLDGGVTYTRESGSNINYVGLNELWQDKDLVDQLLYSPSSNLTASFLLNSGSRDGLDVGQTSAVNRTFQFQSVNNTNTAVPKFDPNFDPNLNYGNRAFNNGGVGKLEFYVNNNDVPVRTFDLEANLAAVSSDSANGITINLFATASNLDSNTGDEDPLKHYRSGSFIVEASIQRDGYNFAYVIHSGSASNPFVHVTNFAEWFYDFTGSDAPQGAMTTTDQGVISNPSFDMTATSSISGIKFFDTSQAGASVSYGARIENQYKNVYPQNGGIQMINVTGDTVSNITLDQSGSFQVNTQNSDAVGTGNAETSTFNLADLEDTAGANATDTRITASVDIGFAMQDVLFYQPTKFINSFTSDAIESSNNVIKFTPRFTHISGHKSNLTLTEVTLGDYMLNQMADTDTNEHQFEAFQYETYRITSRSYATSETASISTYAWDSEKNVVNGGAGYNGNNIQYYSHLLYPTGAGEGGVFDVDLGPTGSGFQPTNYDTATGEREYWRYFKLTSAADGQATVNIELVGTGSVVKENNTNFFTSDNNGVKIYAWRSHNDGQTSVYDGTLKNVTDDGFRQGGNITNTTFIPFATTDSNIDYSNSAFDHGGGIQTPIGVVKFADNDGGTFNENDFLIIRIVTPANWTGHLDSMAIVFGSSPVKVTGVTYTDL